MLHWLLYTDAGLITRIIAGACIFAVLAAVDLYHNGRRARRWREYTVLLAAVALALVYGALNDQITSRISWEYFYYGKELDKVLGPNIPPDPDRFHWEAAKVGLKATWSAGLILGVVVLLANNPHRNWPRLRNRELIRLLLIMPVTAVLCGILFGYLGYRGALTKFDADFQDMVAANLFRPYPFMATWGVHLGGYIGGAIGGIIAAGCVIRLRRARLKNARIESLTRPPPPATSSPAS